MHRLEGQQAWNASRITRWIQTLDELYHEVDIVGQIAQQGPKQPGRSPSPQYPTKGGNIAFGASRPVKKAMPRRQ
jgi:hypothetical protein